MFLLKCIKNKLFMQKSTYASKLEFEFDKNSHKEPLINVANS
jgi:hypothetical protein